MLVVDIIDAGSNTLIWRGSIGDITITDDPGKMRNNISRAISKIVKQSQKLRAKS